MPLTLSGTTGVSGVDGTAGTPAAQGTDTNTGVFYGTDTVSISTGGTARVVVNSDGQTVLGAGTASLPAMSTTGDLNTGTFYPAADTIGWTTGGSERARIDSSGNLLVGTTSQPYSQVKSAVVGGAFYNQYSVTATTTATQVINAIAGMVFLRDSSVGGSAILVFDVTTGITILTQSGSVFTTSAPTGSQIQVSVGSSPYGLKLTAASGSNNHTVEIGTVLVQ